MKRTVKIAGEARVFNGYTKVDKALIEDVLESGKVDKYSREKVVRPDAVTGLIYNTDTETVVLIRQYRYPTHSDKRSGFIYEAIAGKIDNDEDPQVAFKRECLEEVGYKLKNKNIQFCSWHFATPGYSTEKLYFYLAKATNKDKINKGGGVKGEHEHIEVCEFHYLQFKSMMDDMEDLKTKFLAYEAHYRKFFEKNTKLIIEKSLKKNNDNEIQYKCF